MIANYITRIVNAARPAAVVPVQEKRKGIGSSVVNAAHARNNRLYAHQPHTDNEGYTRAVTFLAEALEQVAKNGGYHTGLFLTNTGEYITFSITVTYPRMSCDIQIDNVHYTHAAAINALAYWLS